MLQPPPNETRMYAVLDPDHDATLVPRPVTLRPSIPPPTLSARRKLTLLAPAAALAVLGAAGAAVVHDVTTPVGAETHPSAQPQQASAATGRHAAPVQRWVPVSRTADRQPVAGRHRAVVPPQAPAVEPSTAPSAATPSTAAVPTPATQSTNATVAPLSRTPSASASAPTSASPTSSASPTPSSSPTPTNHKHKSPSPTPSPSPSEDQQGPVSKLLDPVLGLLGG